jgi:hypothetical protein
MRAGWLDFWLFRWKTENSGENIMLEEFLRDSGGSVPSNSDPGDDDREVVQMFIISSADGVTETIHTLFAKDFAEVDEWSPPQPTGKPDQVITILTRYRKRRPIKSNIRKSGR